jgi:hypothetical protein
MFNIVENFIKTNNRPDCVKSEKSSKNVQDVTLTEKSEILQ